MSRIAASRLFWAPVLALSVVGVLWVWLQANHAKDISDPERARSDGRPIPVRTESVSEEDVDQVIGATALTIPSETGSVRIGASRSMNLTAPIVELVIKKVNVRDGDPVKRGQVLFELDDESLQQVARQREAAVASAQAQLTSVKQQVAFNEKVRQLALAGAEEGTHFRTEDLANRQKAFNLLEKLYTGKNSTFTEYFDARSKYYEARFNDKQAQMTLQQAKDAMTVGRLNDARDMALATNNLEIAQIDLELSRQDIKRAKITSPLDGFVNKVDIVPGAAVGVNSVLTQVFQLDPIHVRLDFPQERSGEVTVGQATDVALDGFPGQKFTGTVVHVLPQINPDLRVLPVIVEVKNPGNRVKAGMSGFARVHQKRRAIVAPAAAVLQQGDEAVVFRIEGERARLRKVRAGELTQTGVRQITEGLAPGDQVVIFHNFYRDAGKLSDKDGYLRDDDLVNMDWRAWARRD